MPALRSSAAVWCVAVVVLLVSCPRAARALPPGFDEVTVVSGLQQPTAVEWLPDGRILIAEQRGALRVVKNGVLLPDVAVKVPVAAVYEDGLLGLAVDPEFATNGYIYFYYSYYAPDPNHPDPNGLPKNRVSRFTMSGDAVVAGSEHILLNDLGSSLYHNAGCLRIGPDLKLWIAVGDGSSQGDPQSLSHPFGKLLRINRDGTIPADNPFVGQTGARPEIWCYGLRNPWRFAFGPGGIGPFIGDVGQSAWEEVDVGRPGANYGWSVTEGATTDARFVTPWFTYPTGSKKGAITGGVFLTGTAYPVEYRGCYVYGDYVRGTIRRISVGDGLRVVTDTAFDDLAPGAVDLSMSPSGELHYLSISLRKLVKIRYTGVTGPAVAARPTLFRPSTGEWLVRDEDATSAVIPFGQVGDQPVPADYLALGRSQLAVFRPNTGEWRIRTETGGMEGAVFGRTGDVPVPADYLALRRAQIAVYRPSTGQWLLRKDDGSAIVVKFGVASDLPVPADYFGLRRAQIAVYRPQTSEWLLRTDSGQAVVVPWGLPGDIPVPGDYFGLGRAQLAVYRPSTAEFILRDDLGGATRIPVGAPGDVPVPADYHGVGRSLLAVVRPSTREWLIRTDSGAINGIQWGGPSDLLVPVRR